MQQALHKYKARLEYNESTMALDSILEGLPEDYVVTSQAFTKKTHRELYTEIDPSNATLSQAGKVVIITGASRGLGHQV